MTDAAKALAASTLFEDLDEETLTDIGRLMQREEFAAGTTVFEQDAPGTSMMVVESGLMSSNLAVANGKRQKLIDIEPGDVIGELALLGDGRRGATLEAIEDTVVWSLDRAAFDVLRNDTRHSSARIVERIGLQAVKRLGMLYDYMRGTVDGVGEPASMDLEQFELRDPEPTDYIRSTLFFETFTNEEIEELTADLRTMFVKRGTVLWTSAQKPEAFGVVLRGAVETSIRGETTARRMRLSGPGRGVAVLALLGDNTDFACVESRAREDTVLLIFPWSITHELIERDDRLGRKFSDAIWSDVVRAVQYGEHPLPLAIAHAPAG